ncbi:hypothetical protein E3T61_03115 [Cryobacterium lactosi]|uniref:DUF86 domain-containing protein n=1 Tax=Cryobacterium lactosi TaxID=1259202 RepID=A0A4R9BY24_9MICO|nr:hypothetical protein [Cryobacterium lactosi]TFD94003.1 hypothetical protein E3T61_03115 [Cryobacterium lactosi]
MDRITVNWLRHEHMDGYEEQLAAIYGQFGVHEAYPILKAKVLAAIAETLPELRQACQAADQSRN